MWSWPLDSSSYREEMSVHAEQIWLCLQ